MVARKVKRMVKSLVKWQVKILSTTPVRLVHWQCLIKRMAE
jgi:hypothetical protein